jgi:glycosyltransferase involved in cell wall biosynthesis
MAQVCVGVPVYNGADYLEKSLSCLRDQTYREFEVLIYDNCSTDATGEISERFCAEDPRFRYFRQPENRGVMRNFLDVLEAARTPYFMWRAADDTSDLNYIETLFNLLAAHPERDVAASRVLGVNPDGSTGKECLISPAIEKGGAFGRLAQVFLSHPGWVYGLFRREALLRVWAEVVAEYPRGKGSDYVMLFPFAFDRKGIGTNDTTLFLYQRWPGPRQDQASRAAADIAKLEMGRLLLNSAQRHVDRVIKNPAERWFYRLAVSYYVQKHGLSVTKRLRRRLTRPSAAK